MWGRGDAGGDDDEKQGLLSPIVDRTSANYNEEGIKAARHSSRTAALAPRCTKFSWRR